MIIDIPNYRVIKLIGSGGMGMVFLAEDRLERKVAVKVLLEHLSADEAVRPRFFNEAKMMARLSHPAITIVHDFIEFGNRLGLVMEYIDGKPLDKLIGHETGPIPYERALPIFKQILEGVGHAHKREVVHRDLKPGNIIVSNENIVKVTDFGIAKIAGDRGMTRTGVRVGTLSYMAPEQVKGLEADARTDIYSLGVTLYEMLAGRLPFDENTTSEFEIMETILRKELPDPRTYYPHIPESLVRSLKRAMSKDPSERYSSCEEFMEAIAGFSEAPGPSVSIKEECSSKSNAIQNKKPTQSTVEELLRKLRKMIKGTELSNNVYIRPNIPINKLNNAINKYAIDVNKSHILLLYDSTTFGGAKDGFMLTENTIYWHNLWEEPNKISLSDINSLRSEGGINIVINDTDMITTTVGFSNILLLSLIGIVRKPHVDLANRYINHGSYISDELTCYQWKVGPDIDVSMYKAKDWVDCLEEGWRMPLFNELYVLYHAGIGKNNWGPFKNGGDCVWVGDERKNSTNSELVLGFSFAEENEKWDYSRNAVNKRVFAIRS